jgi:uncharacterized protein
VKHYGMSAVTAFDNSFEIPLAPREMWLLLLDLERIVRCVPSVEITRRVDERNCEGRAEVRLGPVLFVLDGLVTIAEIDAATLSARFDVRESVGARRGNGGVRATVVARVEPTDAGSITLMHTEVMLAGVVGRGGRGIQVTVQRVFDRFAATLRIDLARNAPAGFVRTTAAEVARLHTTRNRQETRS